MAWTLVLVVLAPLLLAWIVKARPGDYRVRGNYAARLAAWKRGEGR